MLNSPIFSICIPSYQRPRDICRALKSCLVQSGEFEILIGDDTADESVAAEIERVFPNEPRIRYHHNVPPLRQAENVNSLFQKATGDWIILLHDDDYLEPDALAIFRQQMERYPSATLFYGKQYLETADGKRDLAESENFNREFSRTRDLQGLVARPKEAVLLLQVPSNGFCVQAALAKSCGYPGLPNSGDACDWAFGTQLTLRGGVFVFIDAYLSTYVLSQESIARSARKSNPALRAVQIAEQYLGDQMGTTAFSRFFRNYVGGAITQALAFGERGYARHLIRLAWQDKQVPRKTVVKGLVKYLRPRLSH